MKTIAKTLVLALLTCIALTGTAQAKDGNGGRNGGGYTSTDRKDHARQVAPNTAQSMPVQSPRPATPKREMRK